MVVEGVQRGFLFMYVWVVSSITPLISPGGYLGQKAMNFIDYFALSGLSLMERRHMTSRYLVVKKRIGTADGNSTEDQRIHLLDFEGQGTLPPIIILHGICSCGADYYPLIRQLQRNSRRVVALDLPGHGLSVSNLDMTLEQMVELSVEAVQQCVDEIHPVRQGATTDSTPATSTHFSSSSSSSPLLESPSSDRPILLGNSLGGFVATKCAASGAIDLGGLVLMSPGGAPLSHDELNRVHDIFGMKTLGDASRFVERVLGKEDNDLPFGVRHVLGWAARERSLRPSVQRIFNQAISSNTDVFRLLPAELQRVNCPVLLVWGKKEEVFLEHHFEWFHLHFRSRRTQRTQVFRPEKLGHVPQLDGEMLAGAVAAFLRDTDYDSNSYV